METEFKRGNSVILTVLLFSLDDGAMIKKSKKSNNVGIAMRASPWRIILSPPTEGRIALTAYFLHWLADWFLDVRRKR